MKYSDLLVQGFRDSNLSLRKAVTLLREEMDLDINYSYLSKLKSGNRSPASDKVNDALAEILQIDPIELKAAAYREKIPPEVLKRIQNSA